MERTDIMAIGKGVKLRTNIVHLGAIRRSPKVRRDRGISLPGGENGRGRFWWLRTGKNSARLSYWVASKQSVVLLFDIRGGYRCLDYGRTRYT